MRRIERDGRYVNLVPRGRYGDVSGDPNMGEVDGPEAEALTFFLYEEIEAFRHAAEATGLSRGDLEAVFCGNAERMIERARGGRRKSESALRGGGPLCPPICEIGGERR
jgi:hypothetical protein